MSTNRCEVLSHRCWGTIHWKREVWWSRWATMVMAGQWLGMEGMEGSERIGKVLGGRTKETHWRRMRRFFNLTTWL